MTLGFDNLTENATLNTTIGDVEGGIGKTVGEWIAGSYGIVGLIFLGFFAYILYRANVDVDTGAIFMIPAMFVFGKYGMLPGGSGTVYGLVLAVGGLLTAGLYRYFR